MSFDISELLTLYDIFSFSYPQDEEDLMQEIIEKSTRLFGVRRLAFMVWERGKRDFFDVWGFKNEQDFWDCINQDNRHSFLYPFVNDKGLIYFEQKKPVSQRDRRLFTIFARRIEDIVERRLIEKKVIKSEREKAIILDSIMEHVIFQDTDYKILWANRAAAEFLDTDPGSLVGRKCYEVWRKKKKPCTDCLVEKALKSGQVKENSINSPDGRTWFIRGYPVRNERGEIEGVVETSMDITIRVRYEERLKYLSLHDQLTGLYNRAYFEDTIEKLDSGREYPITIISADLDGLKLINDTMGHLQGDELLKRCSHILRKNLRKEDVLARVGGDEFIAILPRTGEKTGDLIVKRISKSIDEYNSKHSELPLMISLGRATSTDNKQSLLEVIKKADNLMYREKFMRSGSVRSQLVNTLMATMAKRDYISKNQVERIKCLCQKMGEKLGLSSQQLTNLAMLAQVHNLGKVGIPDSILWKNGPLTEDEWGIIKQHPEIGYRIASSSPDLAPVAPLILRHHERWDGTGYPLGIKGTEIPVECRILSLAVTYDAITNERPYRKAKNQEAAVAEIKKGKGTQFDPQLVDVFILILEEEKVNCFKLR